MKEIVVLMNCRNGSKYLRESLDSLKRQTYKNFKVLFVDNQSTDNSCEIAVDYKRFFELSIVKTEYSMGLGAARAFGLDLIDTPFFTILDTDDCFLDNALEVLYHGIKASNFAVVYGNQLLMNDLGDVVGKIINKYINEEGYFFDKLLVHWDIPIVGVIVDNRKIKEANINFDRYYLGSEEFDFFLHIAANFEFRAISNFVVKYRQYFSLSSELGNRREIERRYALQKLKSKFPQLALKHKNEFHVAFAKCEYFKALHFFELRNFVEGRRVLRQIAFVDVRYFILMMISYNKYLCLFVLKKKYGLQLKF